MPRRQRGTAIYLVVLLMLVCALVDPSLAASAQDQPALTGPLNSAFQQAAQEFDLPRDLLVTIAYAETHFDDHGGAPSIDNGFGLMHLVDNPQVHTLTQAAALLQVDPNRLKTDPAQNIRGGAAVLRALADQQGLTAQSRHELTAWYPVLAHYSQAATGQVGRLYADEVVQLLNQGLQGQSSKGEVLSVAPQPVHPQVASYQAAPSGAADYPDALWVPASPSNYTVANRPSSGAINLIIIHVTEGSYASTINWFQNPSAQGSAHYVIRSSDGQITQMVQDKDIAWHAGNWHYNTRAIGIEHEGYVSDGSWFTDVMYHTSAALVRSLCLKYGIPMDRQHIIGHDEVPDTNHPGQFGGEDHHTDPGPHWNWDYYMQLVRTTPAAPVSANSGVTYFPATGHNLGGVIASYWNANGGLPVFGYPLTEQFPEWDPDTDWFHTVQYFERQRFEYHPENTGTPYVVLLGRLGENDAQNRGLLGTAPFQPVQSASDANCDFVPETGHRLCAGFRAYWHSHGLDFGDPGFSYRESLALFGYPISEEFTDPTTGLTVQYFERARFEYHPEYAGTPYSVLLGLLGTQVLQERGWSP